MAATFDVTTAIISGSLTIGETVTMESTLTTRRTGKLHRVTRSSGVFVGDFEDVDGGHYFMFRDGIIGETPQRGHHAAPVANFSADVLAAYGEFKFDAQHIHEGK